MTYIVLAAGRGEISPTSQMNLPRCLESCGDGRRVLDSLLENAEYAGVDDILIVMWTN